MDRHDLKGRIVTGEAMFCQKSIVAKIIENGRDYVLPVKDNQKNLRENIQTAFNSSPVCERVEPNISTPDADMCAFSPERPTKVSSPCTVDAGHFQYETDFFNYTHTNYAGAGTQSYETFDPTIKPGITNWMDFEVVTGCYQNTTTYANLDGSLIASGRGYGDTFFKAKFSLLGNDGGTFALAVIPYVKAPASAPVVSNGHVEGGVIVPLQIALPEDFSLVLQTEYDVLKNANDNQQHANLTDIITLSGPLPFISKDLTLSVEFYSAVGTDAFIKLVYTFDVGLGYLIFSNMQLDVGANFGVTRASPDLNVYTGFSVRF